MSSSGNTNNSDNQNRSYRDKRPAQPSGKYNQTMGSAKQSVGTLFGNEALLRAGAEQNRQGQNEEAQKHVQDWGEGVEKRVRGKVGGVLAAGQPGGGSDGKQGDNHMQWKKMHDKGKLAQKKAEANMGKRWG